MTTEWTELDRAMFAANARRDAYYRARMDQPNYIPVSEGREDPTPIRTDARREPMHGLLDDYTEDDA